MNNCSIDSKNLTISVSLKIVFKVLLCTDCKQVKIVSTASCYIDKAINTLKKKSLLQYLYI